MPATALCLRGITGMVPVPVAWKNTGGPGQETCSRLNFQCFKVERFWKYEGIHIPIILFEIEPVQKTAQKTPHGLGNLQKAKQTTFIIY